MDESPKNAEIPKLEIAEVEITEADNVPLIFNIPVGLSARFAHHLLLQSTDTEVTLSFFEIIPPM